MADTNEDEHMEVLIDEEFCHDIEEVAWESGVCVDRYDYSKSSYSAQEIELLKKAFEDYIDSRKKELKGEVLSECEIREMKPWAEPFYHSKIKKDTLLNYAEDLVVLFMYCLEKKVDLLMAGF